MYKDPEVRRVKHKKWAQSPAGKAWQSQYQKEYAKRNPDKIRQWRANRREEIRAYMKEYRRKYYLRNKPRIAMSARAGHLKRQYGLSLTEFRARAKAQNNRCKICTRELALFVDHNHDTNQIRDLLCRKCNSILGYASENTEILRQAIRYLDRWSEVTEA